MQPLLREGELIKRFNAAAVDAELLIHVRLAACILTHRTHVIAIVRDGNSRAFRIYDNDSKFRQQGRFELRGVSGMHINATVRCVLSWQLTRLSDKNWGVMG